MAYATLEFVGSWLTSIGIFLFLLSSRFDAVSDLLAIRLIALGFVGLLLALLMRLSWEIAKTTHGGVV